MDFHPKQVIIDDAYRIKLELWDIVASSDRAGRFLKSYFKNASGVLLVYDPSQPLEIINKVSGYCIIYPIISQSMLILSCNI
jgi:GTPase SAR1 family protein